MRNELYNLYEITNREAWNSFVTSQNHTFLHSWAWGEFNEAMGNKVWRLGVFSLPYEGGEGDGSLVAAALIIRVRARRGNFLFIPHGPIFAAGENRNDKFQNPNGKTISKSKFQILKTLTEYLWELAKGEKVNFIRISPLLEDSKENKKLFKDLGFRPAPIHMHAETTWSLNLTPTEDELLMGMRKTTRNLIRRSAKEGVIIKSGDGKEDVEIFNNLYKETVKKHGFTPFSFHYLKNEVNASVPDIKIFTAYYNNDPIASAIIIFYGKNAFYHHGASSLKYPKIPAAYLLQWEAIREAKRRGHKFYNFWGIIKQNNKQQITNNKHPWSGITLFKTGFGGFQTDYIHARDLPLSWKYWPNYVFETIRRVKRGL